MKKNKSLLLSAPYIAWMLLFIMLALMVYTVWSFRKVPFERNRKNLICLVLGWGLYLLLKWPIGQEKRNRHKSEAFQPNERHRLGSVSSSA